MFLIKSAKMTRKAFERLVREAVASLPPEYLRQLENVDLVIEEWPSQELLNSLGVSGRGLLFGLYQGTPKTKRTGAILFPDKITVFAGPVLMVSPTHKQAKQRVMSVVRHEIAHHFGLDEVRIRKTGH